MTFSIQTSPYNKSIIHMAETSSEFIYNNHQRGTDGGTILILQGQLFPYYDVLKVCYKHTTIA